MSTACPDPAQRGQLSVDVSGKLAVKNDILKKTTASKGYVVACWACRRRSGMLMTQSQPRQHELHFPQHLAPKVPQRVQLDSGTTQQYLSCPSCLFPDRACKRERYRKEGDNIALNWARNQPWTATIGPEKMADAITLAGWSIYLPDSPFLYSLCRSVTRLACKLRIGPGHLQRSDSLPSSLRSSCQAVIDGT